MEEEDQTPKVRIAFAIFLVVVVLLIFQFGGKLNSLINPSDRVYQYNRAVQYANGTKEQRVQAADWFKNWQQRGMLRLRMYLGCIMRKGGTVLR